MCSNKGNFCAYYLNHTDFTYGCPILEDSETELHDRVLYSENAWVCAKWQWNARDCYTGLHECNPVTPVECISMSFRTHPCSLAFITHILCINGIGMAFCLVNLIYFVLHIFKIRNLPHCVDESLWNMPFKEMQLGGGRCCCYVVTIVTACSSIMTSRSLNSYCDVTQCMNGWWIFLTKHESPKGDSQT